MNGRSLRLVSAAFLSIALLAGLPAAVPRLLAAPMDLPILDVHAHLIGGRQNEFFGEAVSSALADMNRFNVRKTIVMAPPRGAFIPLNFDYPQFLPAIKRHPGRFAFLGGGGSLNPMMHSTEPAAVTPAVKEKFKRIALDILKAGASGFGEMSSLHLSLRPTHGYNSAPADHPLLLLLADIAAEHDVPIDLHIDTLAAATPTPARLAGNQDPQTLPATLPGLEHLLQHNPKAKIVWDHGGSDQIGETTPQLVSGMMDRYPNLYMSLRPVPPPAPAMNKLFSAQKLDPGWADAISRHSDRFFIGTDTFFVPSHIKSNAAPAEFSRQNEHKLRATRAFLALLPADLARKVAYENAERIYKLKLN